MPLRKFGITCLYGASAGKIAEQAKVSKEFAQKVINDYFKTFSRLKRWLDKQRKEIHQNGFVYSYFGRKRRVPNVRSVDKGEVGHAIRSAINMLVQSVASDVNLLGAIDTHNYIQKLGLDAKIFALVHDSILAEVKEEHVDEYVKILVKCVQTPRGVEIPNCPIGVDVEIGDDYSFGKLLEYYPEEFKDGD